MSKLFAAVLVALALSAGVAHAGMSEFRSAVSNGQILSPGGVWDGR